MTLQSNHVAWFSTWYSLNYFPIGLISFCVLLLLTNESIDRDSIGRRVEPVEFFFVIEMAKMTKTTLTRTQWKRN